MKFKLFLEKNDIFGFEKEIIQRNSTPEDENPIKMFNVEELVSGLGEKPLPSKHPHLKFIDEVIWGDGVGAMKVWVGKNLLIGIDKKCADLMSNEVWVNKKIYQINRAGFGGFEKNICEEIFDEVQLIDKESMDSPKKEYPELPNLVMSISNKLKRTAKDIFIFEGIKKLNDHNYLIKFGVRGQGVQARNQQKVIENVTDVSFDNKIGVIKVMNYNVNTKTGHDEWKILPKDLELKYLPSQDKDEIADNVSVFTKWY